MSANQPLRKPRHVDGRLMSEDEIRGLDGDVLRQLVGVCVMGWRQHGMDGDEWFIHAPSPNGFVCHSWGAKVVPRWESDIAAAFTVDRSEWRWSMGDTGAHRNRACVMVWVAREAMRPLGAQAVVLLDTDKLTPSEYAKARCIAALLLAANIGE